MHIRSRFLVFLFLGAIVACRGGYKKAEDAQDAGREFIRASLDGDYDRAGYYLLRDSVNELLITKWQQGFDRLEPAVRESYRSASILPIRVAAENDSVTTYTFSNSFRKDTTTLKIVRVNGEWLVDLKEILNKH